MEIFREGQKPTRSFREIGLLTDDGREDEQSEIEGKMIKKAQKMGGHALIFDPLKDTGFDVTPFGFGAKKSYLFKAHVVVWQ